MENLFSFNISSNIAVLYTNEGYQLYHIEKNEILSDKVYTNLGVDIKIGNRRFITLIKGNELDIIEAFENDYKIVKSVIGDYFMYTNNFVIVRVGNANKKKSHNVYLFDGTLILENIRNIMKYSYNNYDYLFSFTFEDTTKIVSCSMKNFDYIIRESKEIIAPGALLNCVNTGNGIILLNTNEAFYGSVIQTSYINELVTGIYYQDLDYLYYIKVLPNENIITKISHKPISLMIQKMYNGRYKITYSCKDGKFIVDNLGNSYRILDKITGKAIKSSIKYGLVLSNNEFKFYISSTNKLHKIRIL